MAVRRPYAGTGDAYIIDTETGVPLAGRDGGGNVVVSGKAYTAATGGSVVTDLTNLDGSPITGGVLVPDQYGRIPRFNGPNNDAARLWLDFGSPAGRVQLLATDLPERVAALEDGGGGGSAVAQPPAVAIVYSANYRGSRPATNTGQYQWTCDGTSDQTEINAAIAAANAKGGGRILLLGPTFDISGSIQLRTNTHLDCSHAVITATSNFQGGMIVLFDQNTHRTTLTHFNLAGEGKEVHGIFYTLNTGQNFSDTAGITAVPDTNPDPAHVIHDGNIRGCGSSTWAGHGMLMRGGNLRAGKYSVIRIQNSTGCNVWVDGSVDSHYTDIEVGSAGSGGPSNTYATSSTAPVGHGFYIGGDQNSFSTCKAWFSRGAGFYGRAVRTRLSGCEAQDNYSHGFHIQFGKSQLSNCSSDSNGQWQDLVDDPAPGRGSAGFYFAGDSTVVSGCLSFDRLSAEHNAKTGHNGWQQLYGFQWGGTGFKRSRVTGCVTYDNQTSSVTGTFGAGTTVDVCADDDGK